MIKLLKVLREDLNGEVDELTKDSLIMDVCEL